MTGFELQTSPVKKAIAKSTVPKLVPKTLRYYCQSSPAFDVIKIEPESIFCFEINFLIFVLLRSSRLGKKKNHKKLEMIYVTISFSLFLSLLLFLPHKVTLLYYFCLENLLLFVSVCLAFLCKLFLYDAITAF